MIPVYLSSSTINKCGTKVAITWSVHCAADKITPEDDFTFTVNHPQGNEWPPKMVQSISVQWDGVDAKEESIPVTNEKHD